MRRRAIFVAVRCFRKIPFLLIQLLLWGQVYAQLQPLKHTDFKEMPGMPNRVIKCIAEDSNGVLWASSENSLQWFDGTSFHEVPYGSGPHQVPGLIFNQLYRSPENEIWIFYNKGFSVYQPFTHNFKHYKDIIPAIENEVFIVMSQGKDELVLSSGQHVYYINRHTKKILRYENNSDLLPNAFGYNISINAMYRNDSSVITIQKLDGKPPVYLERPEPLLNFSLHYFSNSIALYATDHYLSFFNATTGQLLKTIPYPNNKYLQAYKQPSNIIQKNRHTVLALLDEELWEIDLLQMEFTKKLVTLTGSNFIANGYFKNALYDSRGNLWVTSNLHGLIKISGRSQPVKLIAHGREAQHFVKCFTVDKEKNLIMIGTYGRGLMLYDTSGNFIRNFPLATHGEGALVTSIGQLDADHYLVFVHGDNRQYIVNTKNMTAEVAMENYFSPGYYSEMQEFDRHSFFYSGSAGMNKIEWQNNRLSYSTFKKEELEKILSKPVIKAKLNDISKLGPDPYFINCLKRVGLQQIGMQSLAHRNGHWLFATIKGIYEFDRNGDLIKSYTTQTGLSDDYIYAMIFDNNGDLWCSHNKGLSRIDNRGHIFNLGKEDGLQSDEFNYGAAAKTADGQLFFGGVNGLNSFYPNQLSSILDTPRLIVTHISSNENILPPDTAFWNVKSIQLPFRNNRIKIKFSAIGNNLGGYYNYQYRVKGLDYEWKDLGHTQEINLALPSGNYSVEIAVSNFFNKDIQPQKIISVEIVPPYYQRWWFLTLASLALLGLLALVMQTINRNRYRKKLEAIKMQQELETERQRISRDLHDNMGAYTTALLANVEKLRLQKGENDELVKMKTNADHILNSLRETIWVLNNKEISVSDFSDAFKSYCIKALQNFENISFEAGEINDDNKMLTAAEAIHFDKILKEAFQNIIKHSNATQIHFTVISNSKLLFSIADNGKGYDVYSKTKGNGLENMRWRAKEAGVLLTMDSAEDKGSIITITK